MNSAVVATEPAAEEAAHRLLEEGATAAEALIAGFLGAAAARASVLWSPVHVLIAGPGAFARAFEGRPRQPGLDVPRPRGVVKEEATPLAARVAVPGSLGALSVLHAFDGTLPFTRLAAPAVERAKANGSNERRDLLTKVGRLGAAAFRAPPILRPLLAIAGRTEGGLLSERDFSDLRPESLAAREIPLEDGRTVFITPWSSPEEVQRPVEIIIAADPRGGIGVLSYSPDDEGLPVAELGITLGRDAVVVRRGVPRVPPGEVLPSAAPIAIGAIEKLAFMALGVRSPVPLSRSQLAEIFSSPNVTGAQSLAAARDAAGGVSAVGLVRAPKSPDVQRLSLPSLR